MTPVFANSLVNVDPGLFIWTAVVFFGFLLILGRFVWKPLLASLSERESSIRGSLEAAEQAMKNAEEIRKNNDAALREAEALALKLRREAVEEAERVRAERIEKAKSEADELLAKAKQTIETEKKRALDELRQEVADLAIQAAGKILHAELDAEKNRKLVDRFLQDLNRN